MIAITKLKIDERGRITLPKYLLEANGWADNTHIDTYLYPVYNDDYAVKIRFVPKEEKNG